MGRVSLWVAALMLLPMCAWGQMAPGALTSTNTGIAPKYVAGGASYFQLPDFATVSLPSPSVEGCPVWDSSLNTLKIWDGSAWDDYGTGVGGPFLPLAGGTMLGNLLADDFLYDLGANSGNRWRYLYANKVVLKDNGTNNATLTLESAPGVNSIVADGDKGTITSVGAYTSTGGGGAFALGLTANGGNTVWDASCDGAGSGLDADMLDGQSGAYYFPAGGGTLTGNLTMQLPTPGCSTKQVIFNNWQAFGYYSSGGLCGPAADYFKISHSAGSYYKFNLTDLEIPGELSLWAGAVTLSSSGLDFPTAGAEAFNIQNSGAGTMTLQVDGAPVLTSEADTLDTVCDRGASTDKAIGLPAGSLGAPSIWTTGDSNTGLWYPAADSVGLQTDGVDMFKVALAGGVYNEGGGDADLRAEGDNDANLWHLDAGTDRVGIGTNAPGARLAVIGRADETQLLVKGFAGQDASDYAVLVQDSTGVRKASLNMDGGAYFNQPIFVHDYAIQLQRNSFDGVSGEWFVSTALGALATDSVGLYNATATEASCTTAFVLDTGNALTTKPILLVKNGGADKFMLGPGGESIYEGSSEDGNEITITPADPTADRTQTLPDDSGTVVLVTSGAGAPGSTPGAVGMLYVDTTNHKLYFSDCTSGLACWVIAN